VDSNAIKKNLPVNVNATIFFRTYFNIYSINSTVYGNCLVYGSLNAKRQIDYNNHSIPYECIYQSSIIETLNYFGYQ